MKHVPHCIACNKTDFSHLYETRDRMFDISGLFTVLRCRECGLAFLKPQPSQKTLKKHYPHHQYYSYKIRNRGLSGLISQFRSYLVRHYYQPTLISKTFSILVQGVPAIPKKPNKTPGKILDVGCGSGSTLVLLQELGWKVYGLEIDKNAVKIAKDRGLENVILGGHKQIGGFPDNYFDCIRLYHVIEHIPDPRHCLQLISKKLKPGGEIILGTPNFDSLLSRLFGMFWYNLDVPRHLFLFSPNNLANISKREGFSHISVSFCSGDGLGRSIIYMINEIIKKNMDTNKFTLLFFLLYPLEWISDKLKIGDIIILRGTK